MVWIIIGVVLFLTVVGFFFYMSRPICPGDMLLSQHYKIPDLRISDDAPDWYLAKVMEKELSQFEEMQRKRDERQAEKDAWMRYHEQVAEVRARRWKEGKPVTKSNPLTEDEMPARPYISPFRSY